MARERMLFSMTAQPFDPRRPGRGALPPGRANSVRSSSRPGFVAGVLVFGRSLRLLCRRPLLLPWVLAPAVVTLLVYVAIVLVAIWTYAGAQEAFFAERDAWYWTWTGARWIAWLVFITLLVLLWLFTFVIVGSVVAEPFNDLLSQRVENILRPADRPGGGGLLAVATDLLRGLSHALLRAVLRIFVIVVLLPINLIPAVGTLVYSALMTYFMARSLAWDALDYSLSRRRLSFSGKRQFFKAHRESSLGLGLTSFLFLLVPPITLVVLPLMAIGGTILYCDIVGEEGET